MIFAGERYQSLQIIERTNDMLKLKNIQIAPDSLGNRMLLVDCKPAKVYKDGEVVPNQYDGYKYRVLLLDRDLDDQWVKVPGPQAISLKDRMYVPVRFEDVQIRCDEIDRVVISVKAKRIIEIKD